MLAFTLTCWLMLNPPPPPVPKFAILPGESVPEVILPEPTKKGPPR